MKKKILVIDDDPDMCILLSRFLERNGYEAEVAHSGHNGIARFKQGKFDIVICDYRLGDIDGKAVLTEIKAIDKNAIVLIITGYSDIKIAVDIIKMGAYDYITKPLIPAEVLNVITAALADSSKEKEHKDHSTERKSHERLHSPTDEFVTGQAPSSLELYNQISIVAGTDYSVILYGESGTGKEVIARAIHDLSKRSAKPFIAMDCGTLSRELSGSELFGHVKGAFTGAQNDKEGHFELAEGGTLFLDEVANLSYDIQASLLRVIQERKFKRVGGTVEMPLDIRIIIASNENLQQAYQQGKFREDLYHRFNEFSINLPPLRKRKEDIPLFAEFFFQKTSEELNKEPKGFDDEVMAMFMAYSWPGNLREFRNVIRRAVLLAGDELISSKTLPQEIIESYQHAYNDGSLHSDSGIWANVTKKDIHLKDTAAKAEYEAIMKVLKEVNFNKTKAAQVLNVDRKTLYNKIRYYEENQPGATDNHI